VATGEVTVDIEPEPQAPAGDGDGAVSPTQQLLREPRLDSLDAPRPAWRAQSPEHSTAGSLATAATEPLPSQTPATAILTRPPTAAEVARTTAETMAAVVRLAHPGELDPAGRHPPLPAGPSAEEAKGEPNSSIDEFGRPGPR
jgi:hypothetical protein